MYHFFLQRLDLVAWLRRYPLIWTFWSLAFTSLKTEGRLIFCDFIERPPKFLLGVLSSGVPASPVKREFHERGVGKVRGEESVYVEWWEGDDKLT